MARVDYERMSADYERGRGLSLEALEGWRDAIARFKPADAARVLDVGSGTGLLADAIAQWFDLDVLAVEPAAGMRREAARAHAHPHVAYVGGVAEDLPIHDSTVDLVWLSTVIHHFRDLPRAAREVSRALRPRGVVMIRSSFPGRHRGISLFSRFFPAASRVAMTFPSLDETVAAFAAARYVLQVREGVAQVTSPSLAAYLERVRTRADTTLTLMRDADFAAGVAALEREVASEVEPTPVVDVLDLLVLTRSKAAESGPRETPAS